MIAVPMIYIVTWFGPDRVGQSQQVPTKADAEFAATRLRELGYKVHLGEVNPLDANNTGEGMR